MASLFFTDAASDGDRGNPDNYLDADTGDPVDRVPDGNDNVSQQADSTSGSVTCGSWSTSFYGCTGSRTDKITCGGYFYVGGGNEVSGIIITASTVVLSPGAMMSNVEIFGDIIDNGWVGDQRNGVTIHGSVIGNYGAVFGTSWDVSCEIFGTVAWISTGITDGGIFAAVVHGLFTTDPSTIGADASYGALGGSSLLGGLVVVGYDNLYNPAAINGGAAAGSITNLSPHNIKNGVAIAGVTGNLSGGGGNMLGGLGLGL